MTGQSSETTIELSALLAGLAKLPEYEKRIDFLERELGEVKRAGVSTAKKNQKKWLSLRETAEALNVSQKTARRYVERRLLRRNAASRHILIPAEDVERFAAKTAL